MRGGVVVGGDKVRPSYLNRAETKSALVMNEGAFASNIQMLIYVYIYFFFFLRVYLLFCILLSPRYDGFYNADLMFAVLTNV